MFCDLRRLSDASPGPATRDGAVVGESAGRSGAEGEGMRTLVITALMAALTGFGGPAHAAPSTIFIAEAQVGYTLGSLFPESPDGLAGRLTLGAGGKFRGLPTRFYGIVSLGTASLTGTSGDALDRATTSRSWTSWSIGVRLLSPIAENLRVLGEVALGRAIVESQAVIRTGSDRYDVDDDALLVELAIGLQYRIALNFSIGARAELAIPTNLDEFDLVSEMAGGSSQDGGLMNPSLYLTLTLHL